MVEQIKFRNINDYRHLIGKDFMSAKEFLRNENKTIRCIFKDGKSCVITDDLDPDRLNVSVENGLIDEIYDFT